MEFNHVHTAHCENGVVTSLLRFHGITEINEPLAFGIGSGLFYAHIPFIKIAGGPMVAFRNMPGRIFSRTCKALNVKIVRKKFKSTEEAKAFLDQKIEEKTPVGCQVGVFHLTYFPPEYRFHFNAHNLIVYGKDGDNYLISDPVLENVTRLDARQLERARFAQGPLAPKGHVYYPVDVPALDKVLLRKGIINGINRNVRDMLLIPAPGLFIGTDGIKFTARRIRKIRDKLGLKESGLYLGQIVRMQEEIGTGGAGFRFLYGAFLEQAADYLQDDRLLTASDDITKAGDLWRNTAVMMAGIYKGRLTEQKEFTAIADLMYEISDIEKGVFKYLKKLNLKSSRIH